MKRRPTAELLDTDAGTPAEISASLADLQFINRAFGGISTTESMIRGISKKLNKKTFSLLEVAAGAGYVPQLVQERLGKDGILLKTSLLDRAWSHLDNGKSSTSARHTIAGDALALPFEDNSFDLIACNLFAHHLSPVEIIAFGNEALRVCRTAVLINDLVRHRFTWLLSMRDCRCSAAALPGTTLPPRLAVVHRRRNGSSPGSKPRQPELKSKSITYFAWAPSRGNNGIKEGI